MDKKLKRERELIKNYFEEGMNKVQL